MDLTDTESEAAFRAECRAWLEANVPAEPLPSGDTREGFALHLEWERQLFADRWSVVSWPEAYGGRDATLWEWLIFEEEYYRAGAPQRVTQNGIFLLAPTIFEFGTPEQQDRLPAPHGRGRGPVVPGLERARRRQRPGRHQEPGRARRRRPAAGASPARRPGPPAAPSAPTCSACSAPIPTPSATTGMTYLLVPLDADGRHRAGRRPPRRRRGLRRGVLRGRVRARRRRARRRRPGLGRGHGHHRRPSGASRCAAPAGSPPPAARLIDLYRRRGAGRRRPSTWRDAGGPGLDGCRGLPALHAARRHRPGRRAVAWRPVEPQQGLVVRARRARCTRPRSTCSDRWASSRPRRRPRSTAAPG